MADPESSDTGSARPRGLLRRHASVIVTTALLVAGGAYTYARLEQPTYTASARVLVAPYTLPNAANPAPDMGTEQAIATSEAVLGNAANALALPEATVRGATTVSASVTADVLDVGYSASTAQQASQGATAVAAAYMAFRAAQPLPSPRKVDITKTLLVPAVKTRLISPAAQPDAPSSPDPVLDVLAGLIVGLLVGIAAAFAVDRFGRRLRNPGRWEEATGVPVLAGLPVAELVGARIRREGSPTGGTADRTTLALHYVRVRISQMIRPDGAVLLLIAARDLPERSVLARSMVEGFADMGRSTTLLPLSTEDGESVETLMRRVERARATHDLVVVTAPPLSRSVMALDVALRAEAALIVDDLTTARRNDATKLIAELRATGCPIAGCVLVGLGTARIGTAGPVSAAEPAQRTPSPPPMRNTTRPSAAPGPLVDWTDNQPTALTHNHVNGSL